jgi:hypothetical protein
LNRSTKVEPPNYKHPHLSAVLYFVKDQSVNFNPLTALQPRRCREAELYPSSHNASILFLLNCKKANTTPPSGKFVAPQQQYLQNLVAHHTQILDDAVKIRVSTSKWSIKANPFGKPGQGHSELEKPIPLCRH